MSEAVFSPDLCDNFAAVSASGDSGQQVLKDIAAWIRAKAKLDADHAAAVKKLCSAPPGVGWFGKDPPITKETTTLKTAVNSLVKQSAAIADAEAAMSESVVENCTKALDEYAKVKADDVKKMQAEGKKMVDDLNAHLTAATKAKSHYESLCKTADKDAESFQKAHDAVDAAVDEKKKKAAQSSFYKAETKAHVSAKKAKDAEQAYRDAIAKYNEHKSVFYAETMPKALASAQRLHEERFETMVAALRAFIAAYAELPPAIDEAISKMKKRVEDETDVHADLAEYVKDNKSKEGPRPDLVFEVADFFRKDEPAETTT